MKVSKLLYAGLGCAVICAVAVAQVARKPKPSVGPRAVGLLELAANGKGHLVPVVILYEGQFYDATSYKASPVPMALDSGTVYEAEKTGAPQGLFTISGALHSNDNHWVGAGTWEAAGTKSAKKAPAPKKKPDEDLDAPPVLHRGDAKKPEKPPESPPAAKAPEPAPSKPAPPPVAETSAPAEDPDRPVLRRGQQTPPSAEEPKMTEVKPGAKSPALPSEIGPVTVIPAISDASGPEPHTYLYPTKPEDEQTFRKKILAMAAAELNNYQQPNAAGTAAKKGTIKRGGTSAGKTALPDFQDVDLKILDLSSSNEPVLVLSAKVLPSHASATPDLQYFITLVAREDIYGDLHKAFSKITDTQHLDAFPRYELIDAVDADGDGRGELLFRQISDAGKAFILYRVIGDQLWPLYEGAPQ
jgi:outer membrane biosynthesis protein TonB